MPTDDYSAANMKAKDAAQAYINSHGIARKPCQVCGNKSRDMHHPDGRKPLQIVFLCRSCHMKVESGSVKCPKPYNLVDLANNKGGDGMADSLITLMATATYNRRETFEGREHLVAPVVALVHGVANGELATAEEIGKYIDSWNGIPLPIDHPRDRGMPVTANQPDLIQRRSVGRFFNANFDGNKLRGELWIDIQKCNQLGGDALEVLNRLERGEPLEVSTAYFRDLEPSPGEYNGEPYVGIQRNLRPDHLALLPRDVGACSWEDGAGAPRVNEKERGEQIGMWTRMKKFMLDSFPWLNQEPSHDEIAELLEQAMIQEKGDAMNFVIRDRFDDYFVYQEAERSADGDVTFTGKMYRREYSIDENKNVTLGDQEEVVKNTVYETVNNDSQGEEFVGNNNDGGESMNENKKVKVEGLITNQATKFTEEDREFLQGLNEEQLDKLEPVVQTNEPSGKEGQGEETDGTAEGQQTEGQTEETDSQEPKSFDEWVEQIPDEEIREQMKENRKQIQQKRQNLIQNLSNESRCQFSKEELEGMKTNQLQKLAESIKPNEDYSGVGGPRGNQKEEDEDAVPPPPPVIMAKREAGANQ